MHPYVARLVELALPIGDWALFGSGPLFLRGWIDEIADLDVLSRGLAWEKARETGKLTTLPDGNPLIEIEPGITVGQTWAYGSFDIDELIETAEMIQGVPCVRLEHVVSYKKLADRPKDRVHLAAIESQT